MYGFLDMATAQKFTQIKEKLKERNRYRDEKMEFKEVSWSVKCFGYFTQINNLNQKC